MSYKETLKMKKHLMGLLVLLSFAVGQAQAESTRSGKPNILVIMTDDQGVGDVGFNNPLVNTPTIDRLASESANFSNFIAAPACAPSRTSFLTGRNHFYAGVWGVGPRGYINREEVYLPEYFRRAGYRTAHYGKWGQSRAPDGRPYLRGYDEAGVLENGYRHKDPLMQFNGELRQMYGWTVDILADQTIDFIRRQTQANTPWYAITAYISPHGPWTCDKRFSDPLEAKGYSKPLATLYGMIEQMDGATKRILDELDRLGLRENTIVIYMSDNGPTDAPGTPLDGPDWAKRNAWNLRGRKSYIWDNGIRVPFTIRWPNHIQAGKREQYGAVEDILPTLLDLAGIPESIVPEHLPLHGISLKDELINPASADPERYYFRLPIAGEGMPLFAVLNRDSRGIIDDPSALDYDAIHATLRGKQFKYHHRAGGESELYDILKDPGEMENIAALYPEKTKELAKMCRGQWDKLLANKWRTFTMPYFLIGDPRYDDVKYGGDRNFPANIVVGDAPLAISGGVGSPYGALGTRGYEKEGDSAIYGIEVVTAGTYRIVVGGENFNHCAPLSLSIGTGKYAPKESTPGVLDFGTISLPVGKQKFTITAGPVAGKAESALVREIAFNRVNADEKGN